MPEQRRPRGGTTDQVAAQIQAIIEDAGLRGQSVRAYEAPRGVVLHAGPRRVLVKFAYGRRNAGGLLTGALFVGKHQDDGTWGLVGPALNGARIKALQRMSGQDA